MPPSAICHSVGLWTRPQGRQARPAGARMQASLQHIFGKLQTRIQDCYLFISSPRHSHRDDGCPFCFDVNAALASSSINGGCRAGMDLLPRHFSLFQFRVGSWFIANSVLVPRWQGESWKLNGSQDYKRQSQIPAEWTLRLRGVLQWNHYHTPSLHCLAQADYEILRNS